MSNIDKIESIAVGLIRPNKHQPRKYFDTDELDELTQSILDNGLISPVTLRIEPGVDGYELIAGERRLRAFIKAFGPNAKIPSVVKAVDDERSAVLAAVENIHRVQMGPAEEAAMCHDHLRFGGREEVARRLCWPVSKVDRRLALMRCIPEVRDALNTRRIQLGHAELLAVVPADKQAKALQGIVAQNLSVAAVRQKLAQFSQKLDGAIFDKDECLKCPYNSSTQRALFAETVDDGYCTHAACYQSKTTEQLDRIKADLQDTYQRVELLLSSAKEVAVVKLIASGAKNAVGDDQAKACRACANFGCTVSGVVGSLGGVERDLCFDPACNLVKAAAWQKQGKSAAATAPATRNVQANAAGPGGGVTKTAVTKTRVASINKKVVEYRLAKWRDMTAKAISKDATCARLVLVALSLTSKAGKITADRFVKAFERMTGSKVGRSFADLLETLNLDDAQLDKLIVTAAASCAFSIDESDLYAIMRLLRVQVNAYWAINAEFLALMTKTEIEAVAEEIGLRGLLEKDWLKLASSKKDEMIAALLKVEGFPYHEALPSVMDWTLVGNKGATSGDVARIGNKEGIDQPNAAQTSLQPVEGNVAASIEPQAMLDLAGLPEGGIAAADQDIHIDDLTELSFSPDALDTTGIGNGELQNLALESVDVDELVEINDFA